MDRAKSAPRISAPSAAPVGIISIDIGGSPAGNAMLPPWKPATPRAAYPIHIQRAPPESAPDRPAAPRQVAPSCSVGGRERAHSLLGHDGSSQLDSVHSR